MTAAARAPLALAALGLAAAFVVVDPGGTVSGAAAGRMATALVVTVAVLAGQWGTGAAVLRRLSPATLEGPAAWAWAWVTGTAVHAALLLPLLLVGLASPVSVLLASAPLLLGLLLPGVRPLPPRPSSAALAVAAALLAPSLLVAFAPPTDTDEIYYQLAVPRQLLLHGAAPGGPLHPDQSRPLPLQLVYTALLALGDAPAARLWNLAAGAALLLAVRELAERRWGEGRGDLPALALLGSYSFLADAGLAYNNLAVALPLLLAADAVLDRRAAPAAWACGWALSVKYTAAPVVAGLGLVAAADLLRERPLRILTLLPALLLPTLPWWLRNLAAGWHPLFPFAGWEGADRFVFVYAEKYGIGHGWSDALRLPFDLVFRAEPDSFAFLGRISALWALLPLVARPGPGAGDRAARLRLVGVVVVGFVGWASGAQLLRYLVPLFGVAALLLGAVPRSRLWWLPFLAALPANLGPVLEGAAERAAVVSGREHPDEFLDRTLPSWPALRWLRDHAGPDEPVALLTAWPTYWVNQPTLLGSVEDHVPTRVFLWQHGEASLQVLRDEGARWVLLGDIQFLRKQYPFLPEPVFQEQLRAPTQLLRALLDREATRVFVENRHEVWRLDQGGALDARSPAP